MDQAQIEANITLEQALRRANLLAAAAEVSQNITQIMDFDKLLPKTVDIICEAYGFYYSGVFLIDEAGEFAVLRAGRGEPGHSGERHCRGKRRGEAQRRGKPRGEPRRPGQPREEPYRLGAGSSDSMLQVKLGV